MPLPKTRLIHPRFEAHHRPLADRQMTAECVIVRPPSSGEAVFDETTGTSVLPPPTPVYDGPCRLTREPLATTTVVVADRTDHDARYRVVIPADAPLAQVGDIVTITRCDGDPGVVAGRLHVTDVPHGSITWQQDLLCTFHQPTTR